MWLSGMGPLGCLGLPDQQHVHPAFHSPTGFQLLMTTESPGYTTHTHDLQLSAVTYIDVCRSALLVRILVPSGRERK